MAHELDMTNGKAAMAYVGDKPWHGLGQSLTEGASIETWVQEAGMDFSIESGEITYPVNGKLRCMADKQVLYRNDTGDALGVVGQRYQVVQPKEVLEFFRDLTEDRGFILETAGVLFNGAKYWALARTPHSMILPGNDQVKEHLLLGTACDGSMATTARYVRTRVVCNNTIQAALRESGAFVRVEHRSKFNDKQVKKELGLIEENWHQFEEQAQAMAKAKVDQKAAADFLIGLFGNPEKLLEEQTASTVKELLDRFTLHNYLGAQDTVWGLVNCITENVDHHRGELQDRRLKSAWFGPGVELKQRVFSKALDLI